MRHHQKKERKRSWRNVQEAWVPGLLHAVDEGMIACKNRSKFLQYMKDKPSKWGFKIWKLVCSVTFYTYAFEIYTGERAKEYPMVGVGGNVVMRLVNQLPRLEPTVGEIAIAYVVFFEKIFTSLTLLRLLLESSILAVGTARISRSGFPNPLGTYTKEFKKARGSFNSLTVKNCVLALVWSSTKVVFFLSTLPFSTRAMEVTIKGVKMVCPLCVYLYRKYIAAVDTSDQNLSYYRCGRATQKWWKRIFWYLIDMSIVNAWVIECTTRLIRGIAVRSQYAFRRELAKLLIQKYTDRYPVHCPTTPDHKAPSSSKQPTSSSKTPTSSSQKTTSSSKKQKKRPRSPSKTHTFIERTYASRACIVKTTKTCEGRTPIFCVDCQKYICRLCFYPYHYDVYGMKW